MNLLAALLVPPASDHLGADLSLPPGVDGKHGLILNAGAVNVLSHLRSRVPMTIPLFVNSVVRATTRQAKAMLTKYNLAEQKALGGGAKEICSIYNSAIANAVLAVEPTLKAWTAVVKNLRTRGYFHASHMQGLAFDLHIVGLTEDQLSTIFNEATKLGMKASVETTPPHLHVEWTSNLPAALSPVASGPIAMASLYRPTQPGGPRDVPGQGGYTYRQWVDGSISIIGVPYGKNPISGIFVPTSRVNRAITAEIGPYQPYVTSNVGPQLSVSLKRVDQDVSPTARSALSFLVAGFVTAGVTVAVKRAIENAFVAQD